MTRHTYAAGAANVRSTPRTIPAMPLGSRAVMAWRDLLRIAFIWYMRERERRALAALDERMLRDVGLSRSDVQVEIDKRFWER